MHIMLLWFICLQGRDLPLKMVYFSGHQPGACDLSMPEPLKVNPGLWGTAGHMDMHTCATPSRSICGGEKGGAD